MGGARRRRRRIHDISVRNGPRPRGRDRAAQSRAAESPCGAMRGFAALTRAPGAGAADYPDHPIKLIVPFGPGGPPDVAARLIGAYLSEHLGPVVVENHVGAGGTLAARMVSAAAPDGYTLMTGTAGSLSISPQLYKSAGVNPLKDFAPVALVSSAPLVLAV